MPTLSATNASTHPLAPHPRGPTHRSAALRGSTCHGPDRAVCLFVADARSPSRAFAGWSSVCSARPITDDLRPAPPPQHHPTHRWHHHLHLIADDVRVAVVYTASPRPQPATSHRRGEPTPRSSRAQLNEDRVVAAVGRSFEIGHEAAVCPAEWARGTALAVHIPAIVAMTLMPLSATCAPDPQVPLTADSVHCLVGVADGSRVHLRREPDRQQAESKVARKWRASLRTSRSRNQKALRKRAPRRYFAWSGRRCPGSGHRKRMSRDIGNTIHGGSAVAL